MTYNIDDKNEDWLHPFASTFLKSERSKTKLGRFFWRLVYNVRCWLHRHSSSK